ncbi:MAG: HPr(Ser) kinase/phosphatase [Clostridiales bacterium]|jgi:HPr kinase/phosphorylase|nr:HPr(Ser) kinase/phosphatase [Clostridiales bacterium]
MAYNKKSEKETKVSVEIGEFAKKCGFEIKNGDKKDVMFVTSVNISRPGLLLADNDEYFVPERIQMLGNAELNFLERLETEKKIAAIVKLLEKNIPCLVLSGSLEPPSEIIEYAKKFNRPVLASHAPLYEVMNNVVMYLNELLAERETVHGVLLDIYGEGVLLTGDSRIGKSETALELIDRGHRLVADDLVVIRRIKDEIIGESPELLKYFLEVRGVGIVDVRHLFGVGACIDEYGIDFIIELEKWNDSTEYERLGNHTNYKNLLGIEIPYVKLPVMPGRNLAIIVEVATSNMRMNKMGYNAMTELDERTKNIDKKQRTDGRKREGSRKPRAGLS